MFIEAKYKKRMKFKSLTFLSHLMVYSKGGNCPTSSCNIKENMGGRLRSEGILRMLEGIKGEGA